MLQIGPLPCLLPAPAHLYFVFTNCDGRALNMRFNLSFKFFGKLNFNSSLIANFFPLLAQWYGERERGVKMVKLRALNSFISWLSMQANICQINSEKIVPSAYDRGILQSMSLSRDWNVIGSLLAHLHLGQFSISSSWTHLQSPDPLALYKLYTIKIYNIYPPTIACIWLSFQL